MNIFDNPNINKELIIEFCDESSTLIRELESILEILENDITKRSMLEKFGQIIDRIMGAARSFNAQEIADFCELGKVIGYKAGQTDDTALLKVVVAILFDAIYLLDKMVVSLRTGDSKVLHCLNTKAFATRLKWLSDKFKHIERASCEIKTDEQSQQKLTQNAIDDLMKSLGL